MRPTRILALLALLVPAAVLADGGSPPSQPSMPPGGGSQEIESQSQARTPRQQAEALYADAWKDLEKARDEAADGKPANAEKRFRRALDRVTQATALDSTYHEAWNLVGYASRKLRLYDAALAAYDRCLRLKPDYAPAREYLGEALIELGRTDEARMQLQFLERMNAKELADRLRGLMPAAKGDSAGARPDSAAARAAKGW